MNLKLTIILIFFTQFSYAQKKSIEFVLEKPKYESIVDVIMGPQQWHENIDSDSEAGFQYRIVITRMEIYETIFIEKLIIDIEGGFTKIEWAKMLNMDALMDQFKIPSEQQNFSEIKWSRDQSFSALFHTILFTARISEDEKYIIVEKEIN
jgi:hypothetical protein